ncbi:TPA: fimbria/pilus outer membrane usher protein [Stenotrophomonas maltophilia]
MKYRAMVLALALACFPTYANANEPQDTAEVLASVILSGREVLPARLIKAKNSSIYLSVEDWRSLPNLTLALTGKTGLISSDDLGLSVSFDEAEQAFKISAPALLMTRQNLSGARAARVTEVDEQPKGVLLNYDIATRTNDSGSYAVSGAHDARIGVGPGTLITTGQLNTTNNLTDYRRGISTWNFDNLKRGVAVQVGDVFTPRSAMTGTVNLGGVRVGSDRVLRRDQEFTPVPLIGGVADTRSAAEIFVNNDKMGSRNVAAGPWDLGRVPVSPGSNDVRVVIRDEFGREEVVSQRFYMTNSNLPKGQREWDIAAGLVRVDSDTYKTPAVTAKIEQGVSNYWTAGATLQTDGTSTNVGLSNRIILGTAGAVAVEAATSNTAKGNGSALSVSYEYRARNWAMQVGHTRYSDNYWQLSQANKGAGSTLSTTTTGSLSLSPRGKPWSLSLAAARIDYSTGASRQRVDLAGRYRSNRSEIGFGVGRDFETKEDAVYVSFRHNFGSTSASISARQSPDLTVRANAQGQADISNQRVRWSASVEDRERGTRSHVEASTATKRLDVRGSITDDERGTELRTRARGSLWIGEGGATAQRYSTGSFAVVEVPGQQGVPVAGSGGFNVSTNKRGIAVLPNVRPLTQSRVSIDTTAIPFEVGIETNAMPYTARRNGGAKVKFDVASMSMVEIQLTTDGKPVPSSAAAVTNTERVIVGHGGVAVLMDPRPSQSISVEFPGGGACKAKLPAVLPNIENRIELICL